MEQNVIETQEMKAESRDQRMELPTSQIPFSFGKWDVWLLVSALLCAGCYFFAHFPTLFTERGHIAGLGFPLTQWVILFVTLRAAKKQGRLQARKNPGGVLLLAISVSLGLCFALFGDDAMRLMNLPVVLLSTLLSLLSLTGYSPCSPLSFEGLLLGAKAIVPSCFIHWALPLRAVKNGLKAEKQSKRLKNAATGILFGVPVVIGALLLLTSADSAFSSLLRNRADSLTHADWAFLPRLLFTLISSLCLYSLMRHCLFESAVFEEKKKRSASSVTLSVILFMLALVYAPFVYVQFRYLFFGHEGALPIANYAEYARSGFFQLVFLSVLTLLLIMPFLSLCKGSVPVRLLCALIALLTAVIDFSAFFRMRLYIQAYGLSVLRLVTIWGMGMILLSLLGCLLKCLFPSIRVFPALTAVSLLTWVCLNYANVDRIVASDLVYRKNAGQLQRLDIKYLSGLSPDVLPALEELNDKELRASSLSECKAVFAKRAPVLYDTSVSWLRFSPPDPREASLSFPSDTDEER